MKTRDQDEAAGLKLVRLLRYCHPRRSTCNLKTISWPGDDHDDRNDHHDRQDIDSHDDHDGQDIHADRDDLMLLSSWKQLCRWKAQYAGWDHLGFAPLLCKLMNSQPDLNSIKQVAIVIRVKQLTPQEAQTKGTMPGE